MAGEKEGEIIPKAKEYRNFISKFQYFLGEKEKGVYHILDLNAYEVKGSPTDRNIILTEHRLEDGHGKKHDKTYCVEEAVIALNVEDLERIAKKLKKIYAKGKLER